MNYEWLMPELLLATVAPPYLFVFSARAGGGVKLIFSVLGLLSPVFNVSIWYMFKN